jgi:thiamine-phosphate pyrophosphorylase
VVSRATFRLLLITDRRLVCGAAASSDALVRHLERAFQGAPRGVVAVQLREKDLAGGALFSLAREVREVTRRAGALFFINDRVDVAMAAGADGVHLPAAGLPARDVRGLWPEGITGRSAHAPSEVDAAAASGADFVLLGPIYDTPSKRSFGAPLGIDAMAQAAAAPIPVYALGGVGAARVAELRRAGAAGIAVIRAVAEASDPAEAVRAMLLAWESG